MDSYSDIQSCIDVNSCAVVLTLLLHDILSPEYSNACRHQILSRRKINLSVDTYILHVVVRCSAMFNGKVMYMIHLYINHGTMSPLIPVFPWQTMVKFESIKKITKWWLQECIFENIYFLETTILSFCNLIQMETGELWTKYDEISPRLGLT